MINKILKVLGFIQLVNIGYKLYSPQSMSWYTVLWPIIGFSALVMACVILISAFLFYVFVLSY